MIRRTSRATCRAASVGVATLVALTLTPLAPGALGAQAPTGELSLYERLGGLPAIALVVSDFIDVFIQDPVILANPVVRERKTPEGAPYIKFQVTALVCEVTEGPCRYAGLDLREAHDGLGVTPAEWDRMGEIFGQVLAAHEVPERETQELFEILGGTRDDIVVADDR